MMVSDLIKKLGEMPPDASVILDSPASNYIALEAVERWPVKKLPRRPGIGDEYIITNSGDMKAVYLGIDALVDNSQAWENWDGGARE